MRMRWTEREATNGEVRGGMAARRLGWGALCAACAVCAAGPVRAQTTVLASWRDAVVSRWEFQQRFPAASRLFAGRAEEAERASLIAQLRPLAIAAPAAPADSRAELTSPRPPRADVWIDFALGLAEERGHAGTGEADLANALGLAGGDAALAYEAARILGDAGLRQRARQWQMETHRSMLAQGYMRMPGFAKLELWRAKAAMGQGQFQSARQSLEFAHRLDPFCPWVPFQGLVLQFREQPWFSWDLGVMWSTLLDTFRLLRYYDAQALFLVNVSRCLRLGLGLFGALGLLTLFARHFTRIVHPWAERLPHAVEMRVRYLATALALASLAIGGAGYALLAVLGMLLLWKHCSRDEKSVLRAGLLGLALIPLLLAWESSMCRHLDARAGENLYHLAWTRGYELPLAEHAASMRARTREDSLYRALALSIQYKKQGNYLRAAEYGREASRLDPDGDFALLNEGTLAMATFEYAKAAKAFATARRQAPDRVETWFNSSQAELYANHSADHKKYLDRAADIDPAWVTEWLNDNDEHFPAAPPARKTMDAMLRPSQAWMGAWRSLLELDFLRVKIRSGILDLPGGWLLAAVALASAGLWFRFRRYSSHSHGRDLFECRICGRIMCRVCRKGVHCGHCFKTVSGVQDNRVKAELVSRLRHRATLGVVRSGSALNSLLPGIGQLYLGRGDGRFLWPLAISLLFGCGWGLIHPIMEYPAFAMGPLPWLPLPPLLLAYGIFSVRQLRSPLTAEDHVSAQSALEKETAR
jgi:tetratricopeptide (TPR) repeat protein